MPCKRSRRKDDLLARARIRFHDEQAPAWKSSPHGTARGPDRGVYEDANGWLCSEEELGWRPLNNWTSRIGGISRNLALSERVQRRRKVGHVRGGRVGASSFQCVRCTYETAARQIVARWYPPLLFGAFPDARNHFGRSVQRAMGAGAPVI